MRITLYKSAALCLLAAGLLSACSSSSVDSDDIGTKYEGSYNITCVSFDPGVWETEELTITGSTGTLVSTVFSDDQCSVQIYTQTITADLSYPGGTQSTERGDADFLDIKFTSLAIDGVEEDLSDIPEAELTEFDIVLLDGINLYLGEYTDEADGSTAENRPTTLESIPFVRQ